MKAHTLPHLLTVGLFAFALSALFSTMPTASAAPAAQAIAPVRDKHYAMLDKNGTYELPAAKGRQYISASSEIVRIEGNTVRALADGEALIYALENARISEFAHLTVGWPLQNPVLPYSWGLNMADPEAHNFDGKIQIFGSLDATRGYCSPYYLSLRTPDLKHWESHGYYLSSFDEGIPHRGRILWDSDGAIHNGKNLLYGFFEWNSRTANYMFVMDSTDPMGRYKNFRWITGDKSKQKIDGISAQVFADDDGTRYIVYAPTLQPVENNYPVIARLVDDSTIAEDSRKNIGNFLKDFYEGPSLRKRNGIYYFIYAENTGRITERNRKPTRLSYATSTNLLGEWTYRGTIITIEDLPGDTNIQGSIEPFNGEWYVFYHRATNNMGSRRALCVEKLTFDKGGLIKPVVPTSSGAWGPFSTNGKPIYFNTAVIKKNSQFVRENDTGFGSALIRNTVELGIRYVLFTGKESKILLQGKEIENIDSVRVLANGKLIGDKFENGTVTLKDVEPGEKELLFIITAKTGKTAKLDTHSYQISGA